MKEEKVQVWMRKMGRGGMVFIRVGKS